VGVPVNEFSEIQKLVIHAIMQEGAYEERERIFKVLDGLWADYEAQGNVEAVDIINQILTLIEEENNEL